MENFVFLAVLFAAACHAGWNALIKGGLDPLSSATLIVAGATVFSLAAVFFVPLPAPLVAALCVIVVLYVAATEGAKRWFFGRPGDSPSREIPHAVRKIPRV